MGITKMLVVGGAVIIFGWLIISNQSPKDDAMMEKDTTMVAQDEAMMEKKDGESMQKSEDGAMVDLGVTLAKAGSYSDYAPEKLALAQEGKLVLFFHAPWCPICRPLDAELRAQENSLPGVHLLKVDFDTATQLRQKYGVTVQHTFVQIDAQGKQIAKWSDATTLAEVLAKVK